jgi:hypothetical protein
MNNLEYLFLIGIVIMIMLLVDIRKLLKCNEVDTYPTHLWGISNHGEIHPIIALGKPRYKFAATDEGAAKQWAVHVRHQLSEGGKLAKPEIWTWPIDYYIAILGHEPTPEEYKNIWGDPYFELEDYEEDKV